MFIIDKIYNFVSMEQFNIIGELKSYAENLGWIFVFGIDNFERNIQSVTEFSPGQLILMCDFRAIPTIRNGQTMAISYTCLMMLGRKIDSDTQRADLDETDQQKYDRRLSDLVKLLNNTIARVGCSNGLEVSPNELVFQRNVFNANIDFAVGNNVVFIDESPIQEALFDYLLEGSNVIQYNMTKIEDPSKESTFDVDLSTGHALNALPDDYDGVDFEINENGHLYY